MTKEQVKVFCDRFMPSYDCYMNNLYTQGITPHVPADRTLKFKLNANREPQDPGIKLDDQS